MPFDAVGFSTVGEADLHSPPRPSRWTERIWRALHGRMRDASGRTDAAACTALLVQARQMIEAEGDWIQGHYVRDGRRCAMGALQEAGRTYWRGARRDAVAELLHVARLRGYHSIESMNDTVSHGEVIGAFDTAIAGSIARRR